MEEWEHFATDVLGLQSNGIDDDGNLSLRMDEYSHRFIIQPTGKDDLEFVGWQVTDEPALQEMAEQLREAGIEVTDGTDDDHKARRVEGMIKFEDPEGTPTEIFYGPPISFERPFNSPRAVGFVTAEQGMGHVVLHVENLDRTVKFYRDVLGMKISDFIRNLAFFHCNPRHHSLALIEAKAPKKLNHFMLQTQSMNEVGATYDMVLDQEIPLTRGLGRHTNDHMTSFYMKTPSGFDVEYGWGARTVDDATWQVQRHEKGSIWGHRAPTPVAAK
jgi:2,3-dihydroxybiphenyl 1,2-dioxygenase